MMLSILSPKLKKSFNLTIRIGIILLSYCFLYIQVFHRHNLDEIITHFQNIFTPAYLWLLLIVFLLMFINWGIEAGKWKFLIDKVEKISFSNAYKAIFSGVTVSIFLPNRVGEFFGRIFILKKTDPWKSIFITILGSISQLLITLVIGLFSLFCLLYLFSGFFNEINLKLLYGFLFLVVIFSGFLLLLYFNVFFISIPFRNSKRTIFRKAIKYLSVLSQFSGNELGYVLFMSFIRYIVFSLQYFLLLRIFGISLPLFNSFLLIALYFFIITSIPTIALAEIGIRGTMAISIFQFYFHYQGVAIEHFEAGILVASSLLWVINIVIPAIIGTFFVPKLHFFKTRQK